MAAHPRSLAPPDEAQNSDNLTVSNLSLHPGILAPYVFPSGPRKLQPATVSISLGLTPGFSSAADRDALDQNTIHYGNLAKAVRSLPPDGNGEGLTLREIVEGVERTVDEMAAREDGSRRVGRCEVGVWVPKASPAGEGVRVRSERDVGRLGRRVGWRFEGVRVMVLIGVNAVERTARQVLEVGLEVWSHEGLDRDAEAFGLETEMVEIIEPTTFETLESLGEHVVKHLRPKVEKALPSCDMMSLTMRKPKAIAFAGAPALTLIRSILQTTGEANSGGSAEGISGDKLNLIKPYV